MIRTGICEGGPLNGKVRHHEGAVMLPPGATGRDGGFYVHRQAVGPKPGVWVWVAPSEGRNDIRRT